MKPTPLTAEERKEMNLPPSARYIRPSLMRFSRGVRVVGWWSAPRLFWPGFYHVRYIVIDTEDAA